MSKSCLDIKSRRWYIKYVKRCPKDGSAQMVRDYTKKTVTVLGWRFSAFYLFSLALLEDIRYNGGIT